jgi:type VI secretion system protein ImpH
MDAAVGRQSDALTFLASLARAPYQYDFYASLRRLECLHPGMPRWGTALRPADEPVRFGQDPELAFAPAPLSSCEPGHGGRPPRLQVNLFGLFGPNGALPTHVTEYARDRLRHADPTLCRFVDIFHHRFLELFYRAWAQGQPHVNRDRREADRFAHYVGAFIGIALPTLQHRDTVPDAAKLFHVGALMRQPRNRDGLAAILTDFFGVAVRVEEFVGGWLPLAADERTRLATSGATLGAGAVLGARVWGRQHRFRIHLGPLTLAEYERFLPGGQALPQLVDWVRMYLDMELQWDIRLVLARDEVPPAHLGRGRQLGWTSWLGRRRSSDDAGDLHLDADRFVAGQENAA